MRGWLTGYAMLIPFFFGLAVAQALFALPSAIASRFSRKAGFITWLITLGLLVTAVVIYVTGLISDPREHAYFLILGTVLMFTVIMPQAVAYPLTRNSPFARIFVAFMLGIALAGAWVFIGAFSGATPD